MKSRKIAQDTWCVDVKYQGVPHMIATGVLKTEAGLILVDPGPEASLDGLRTGLKGHGAALSDVRALFLTHIHLDHAGAAGAIVAEHPGVAVYVHEVGAPHVVDPGRLLRSARRLYGDRMEALWGEVIPVPEENVHALEGGDVLEIGGRSFEVAYTPGHASHHVSYLDEQTGTAFIGDVGGQRTTGIDYVLPVTPPPDVDLEAWRASLEILRAWQPERLFLTHFGPVSDVHRHLEIMEDRLFVWAEEVRESLGNGSSDEARAERFAQDKLAEIRREVPEEEALPYEKFGEPAGSWKGLARYWRKKGVGEREHG